MSTNQPSALLSVVARRESGRRVMLPGSSVDRRVWTTAFANCRSQVRGAGAAICDVLWEPKYASTAMPGLLRHLHLYARRHMGADAGPALSRHVPSDARAGLGGRTIRSSKPSETARSYRNSHTLRRGSHVPPACLTRPRTATSAKGTGNRTILSWAKRGGGSARHVSRRADRACGRFVTNLRNTGARS